MRLIELFWRYFYWHYGRAFADLTKAYVTVLWFIWNFFSIGELLMTFASPFQRIQERYGGGFDLEEFFSIIVVNILMRIVGMVMRSFVIAIGIVVLLSALLGGLLFFIAWVFLPLIVGYFFVVGAKLALSYL
jgi:hypothetical protein